MQHSFKGVGTQIGYITSGRDAIHVDSIEQKTVHYHLKEI